MELRKLHHYLPMKKIKFTNLILVNEEVKMRWE